MNKTTNQSVLSYYNQAFPFFLFYKPGRFARAIVIITLLFSCMLSNATIKTVVGNSGQGWSNANNWNPTGLPQNGDTVVIPLGLTINVKGQIYSSPNPNLLIKIYGTLDFDPSGKIDLSSISTIGIYTGGAIVSNGTSSELITIGGVTKYNGQLDGNISGPRFANANTGSSPNGFNGGVLTIKLVSFDYQKINGNIKLSWTAIHTNDNDRFEIQRSNDGNNWTVLTSLPVSGNLNETNYYLYTDDNPGKVLNFYRIRLVNFDTHDNYSKTIAVKWNAVLKNLTVFPNPSNTETKILWENMANTNQIDISVMNASMIPVIRQRVKEGENFAFIDVSRLPAGIYTVMISDSYNLRETARLFVNK